ncbi:MAG TPA: DUF2950 family protein [Pseudomonadales bacterium]|nr:DUF2950 family protein [Pseudomonadales bacterium]
MKSSTFFYSCAYLLTAAFLAAPFKLQADDDMWKGLPSSPSEGGGMPSTPASNQTGGQQMFASPEDAVKALRAAVVADDRATLGQIFGPQFQSVQTGDKVQDAKNTRHFANAMAVSCNLDKQSDTEFFVDVGTNNYPMAVPLMETNGQWYFNTAAGKEEIIDRHIGKDELAAIGVCHAYVSAQQQFATMNRGVYARKFKSTPGKQDGLYWTSARNEPASKFGPLVAEADIVAGHKGAQAFHGYYFKILTEQGKAAPGGRKDYLSDGQLKNGFALLAYPEHWNQSGVMTFIVNQDGKVYQRNFGDETLREAGRIKEYNPDKDWTLVQDEGILDAATWK